MGNRIRHIISGLVLVGVASSCQSDPAIVSAAPDLELLDQLPGEWYFAGELDDFPGVSVDTDDFPLAYITTEGEVYIGRLPTVHDNTGEDGLKGLSNGVDNRVNNIFSALHPYSAVGRLVSAVDGSNRGCTATVVDNRLILTAAHCVTRNGMTSGNGVFTPGQSATSAPDGSVVTGGALVSGDYLSEGCHLGNGTTITEACSARDWALVPFTPTATIPSGVTMMGVTTAPRAQQLNWTVWNAGYAACGQPHSPSPCPTTQWVDSGCILSNFARADVSGEHRIVRTSCDISPGHSGGPLVQVGTNLVMGVVSAETCTTCSGSSNAPNIALRITPIYLGLMQALFAAVN
jgi:V8-like Glu-specific endopeptidase